MRGIGLGLVLLLVVGLMGCGKSAPPPPVERGLFVEVYAEIQLLEAAHRQRMIRAPRDANFHALRDSVLTKFGVSDSAFTETYRHWYSQPDELSALIDEVIAAIDSLEIQADQRE